MMGILAEITVLLSSIAGVRRKLDPTPAASGSLALRARALWQDSMRFPNHGLCKLFRSVRSA